MPFTTISIEAIVLAIAVIGVSYIWEMGLFNVKSKEI